MKSSTTCLVCICVLFQIHTASAQMPNKVRNMLSRVVGSWEIEDRMEDKVVKSRINIQWAKGGECLVWHNRLRDLDTDEDVSATGIVGWDAPNQVAVERAFTSHGGGFRATFQFTSDASWKSPATGTPPVTEGRPKQTKWVRHFDWKSDDEWHIRSVEEGRPDVYSIFRRIKTNGE